MNDKRTIIGIATILATLLLALGNDAMAGVTGKITGRITDQKGQPLPGVNVTIEGVKRGAITDTEGRYLILSVDPGVYTFTASMIGYDKVTKKDLKVVADWTTTVDFRLTETTLEMTEVVVVAERPPVEPDKTSSKYVVDAAAIESLPMVRSTAEIVSLQPGVAVDGSGRIRGGDVGGGEDTPNTVLYYVDGIRVVNNDGMNAPTFTRFNRSALQEISVLVGGIEAEYGNVEGGVVSLVTKTGTSKFHGELEYRLTPPGKMHWGRNVYDSGLFRGTMRWNDPNWVNETDPKTGRLVHQRSNYTDAMGHYVEASLSGPLGIKDATFFVTTRYDGQPNRYPTPSKISLFNTQNSGNIAFFPTSNMKLRIGGLFSQYKQWESVGPVFGDFGSSIDAGTIKGLGDSGKNIFLPENWSAAGKSINQEAMVYAALTHTLSPKTFYDLRFAWSQSKIDTMDVPAATEAPRKDKSGFFNLPRAMHAYRLSNRTRYIVKLDLTRQTTRSHLLKGGLEFTQYSLWDTRVFDPTPSERRITYVGNNHQFGKPYSPITLGLYAQDKMEFQGLVVNAGLRFDMADPRKAFEHPEFATLPPYNTLTRFRRLPYRNAHILKAWSPRLGVSHPISSRASVHFFTGLSQQFPDMQTFYQESWGGVAVDQDLNKNGRIDEAEQYNRLGYLYRWRFGSDKVDPQRTLSFEAGMDWNFAGDYILALTTFYKDARGQLNSSGGSGGDAWDPKVGSLAGPLIQGNRGSETTRGVEVSFKKAFSRYTSFNVSYNVQWSTGFWVQQGVWGASLVADSTLIASGKYWYDFDVDPATGAEIPKPFTTADIQKWGHLANEYIRQQAAATLVDMPDGSGKVRALDWGYFSPTNPRGTADLRNSGSVQFQLSTPGNFGPKIGGRNTLSDFSAVLLYRIYTGPPYQYVPPSGPAEWRKAPLTTWVDLDVRKGIHFGRRVRADIFFEAANLFNQQDDLTVGTSWVLWGLQLPRPDDPNYLKYGDPNETTRGSRPPRQVGLGVTLKF